MNFFITDDCVKCAACASDCMQEAILEKENKYVITAKCNKCGDCYTICPVGAIVIVEE